mmetsp:Transcript_123317/g.308036  ORF Transcript_123317/g.308036 Transcript_123317/m.308036 type:complete len:209 (-) Transcript_123317:831-1457(-)
MNDVVVVGGDNIAAASGIPCMARFHSERVMTPSWFRSNMENTASPGACPMPVRPLGLCLLPPSALPTEWPRDCAELGREDMGTWVVGVNAECLILSYASRSSSVSSALVCNSFCNVSVMWSICLYAAQSCSSSPATLPCSCSAYTPCSSSWRCVARCASWCRKTLPSRCHSAKDEARRERLSFLNCFMIVFVANSFMALLWFNLPARS